MARDSPQHLPALPRMGWSKGQGSTQWTLSVWGQDLGRENAEAEREGDTGSLSEATNSKSLAGQLETPAGRPVPLLPSQRAPTSPEVQVHGLGCTAGLGGFAGRGAKEN